eukprot:TRINITY_DN2809_c0_g3_i1.p1 TRINITY_DN2809_c0_g3~~TRINITY_DN2809_c0_g3_i1.p1  ORF type:complete len:786 (-),score=136.51 TRINITY_DN2809_c0_g3_i1:150-2507(-)
MKAIQVLFVLSLVGIVFLQSCSGIISSEFTMPGDIIDLEYVQSSPNVVYALNDRGQLFVSWNDGQTWGIESRVITPGNGIFGIMNLGNNSMLFLGNLTVHFRTDDAGATYQQVAQGKAFITIEFHQDNVLWGMGTVFDPNCDIPTKTDQCNVNLITTTDGGFTWIVLETYVDPYQATFGNAGQYGVLPTAIYVATSSIKSGFQGGIPQNYFNLVMYNDFRSRTVTITTEGGNQVQVPQNPNVLVMSAAGTFSSNQFVLGLSVSFNGADQEILTFFSSAYGGPMLPAVFPEPITAESYFTIEEVDIGAVFLSVWTPHNDPVSAGHLYVSGPLGIEYITSLANETRDTRIGGEMSFYEWMGLTGVALSGQDVTQNPNGPYLSQTMISWNVGSSWSHLDTPSVDVHGNPISCTDCTLNLDLFDYTPFTTDRARGYIFANGNIGKGIGPSNPAAQTFLSTDAGRTWSMISDKVSTYGVGYHGSISIIVDATSPQETLHWTLDPASGLWEAYNFTTPLLQQTSNKTVNITYFDPDTNQTVSYLETVPVNTSYANPMYVGYVETQPALDNKNFLLVGYRDNFTSTLVFVSFNDVELPVCRDPTNPGTPESDYELFNQEPDNSCVLGQHLQFLRRKAGVYCYDALNSTYHTFVTTCPCTRSDFQCDYGFNLGAHGECIKDPKINVPVCIVDGTTILSSGYRKIANDKCTGGLALDAVPTDCVVVVNPVTSTTGIFNKLKNVHAGVIAGAVIGSVAGLIIIIVIIYFAVHWARSRAFRFQRKNDLTEESGSSL